MKCKHCEKPLSRKQIFCSSKCCGQHKRDQSISLWLEGKLVGYHLNGQVKDFVRFYILERDEYKCVKCGFNTPHPISNNSILQISHIDGNILHTVPENLESLCPNCHTLTPSWGGYNKGNGRESKGFPRRKSLSSSH